VHAHPDRYLGEHPRGRLAGALVAVAAIALTTLVIYPLKQIAPSVALGVVYLLGVLLVASLWGAWLGVATAIGSAAAFNFFHLDPTGRFTIAKGQEWVALGVFLVTAIVASELAQRARARADEADQRRREAALAAEMARLLLRSDDLDAALSDLAHRLSQLLGLPSAAIELRAVDGDDRRLAFPLREGPRQLGTLLVPADTPEATLRRIQERIVPALEAVLAAAIERDELLGNRVEAAALRRSDIVKTALLRAVSHDLRSPLTAILTAAGPLEAETLSDEQRRELGAVVREEATRLSRLIDNLLDLSRLEADAAEPRIEWCDIGEVIHKAIEDLHKPQGTFRVQVATDMPLIRADAAQLERAFANLLENSARHSGGHAVVVRAWPLQNRIMVRIVDRGPGIPPAQRERVFEPFYRSGTERTGHRGSGLGLAIARGFVQANGGKLWVESLPGQGTSFVLEFPLEHMRHPDDEVAVPPSTAAA
jgi:two-component system, OmpR family, sensor histidine kinase KdpD